MPALPSFDCYSTLEVSKNATESEIHKAYKRLALVHHPDKNPDDAGATARFQQVSHFQLPFRWHLFIAYADLAIASRLIPPMLL